MIDAIKIELESVYDDDALFGRLGVSAQTLASARRGGRLRYSRKGKRILYLGEWVLDWIRLDAAHEQPTREGVSV